MIKSFLVKTMLRGARFKGFAYLIKCLRDMNSKVTFKNKFEVAKSKYKLSADPEFQLIEDKLKSEYSAFIINKINYERVKSKATITDIWKSSDNDYIVKEKMHHGYLKTIVRGNYMFCSCLKPISIGTKSFV